MLAMLVPALLLNTWVPQAQATPSVEAEPAGVVFVQASRLTLRTRPDPAASTAGVLRINTALEVLEEGGLDSAWLKVRVADRPATHPVVGWVHADFLGSARVLAFEAYAAAETARKAGDPDAAITWLERAVAADPSEVVLRNALVRQLEAAGRVDEARELRAPAEILVAECAVSMGVGRVELLGSIDARGRFEQRSSWRAGEDPAVASLSAWHWVRYDPSASTRSTPWGTPIEGSPFVRPFLTESWNESGRSPYQPGTCEEICESATLPVLGPCETDGAIFLSQALQRPRELPEPPIPGDTESLHADLAPSRQGHSPDDDTTLHTWTFGLAQEVWREQGNTTEGWAFRVGSARHQLLFMDLRWDDADASPPRSVSPGVWVQVEGSDALLGFFPTAADSGQGTVVFEVSPWGVQGRQTFRQGSGC